jgi:hypothetical protein
MGELLQTHLLQFVNGDVVDTDTDFVAGGAEDSQTLINNLVVQNNDSGTQTVTVSLQTYVTDAYVTKFKKAYEIAAGESEFIAELMGVALIGAASNPDKITLAFGTALGAGETIDCIGSSVQFS